jgi:L-rhamnose 1-dehydrogenase
MPERVRRVLVTGSSRGIGRATAEAFARAERASVIINHLGDHEAASATATAVADGGGQPLVVEADMADPDAIERMVRTATDELGAIDVAVLNAGVCPYADFFDVDVALWNRTHDVNLRGAFLTAQHVSRTMIEAEIHGSIIGLSSVSALVGGSRQVHYCPTKAGMSALIRSIAIVLGPHGIRCNAVLPGSIETDINRADFAQPGKREYLESRIPLGRLGEPADVADVIWSLTQPAMRYIHGAEIIVDGGLLINLE